jgi:hypothetical protein
MIQQLNGVQKASLSKRKKARQATPLVLRINVVMLLALKSFLDAGVIL